MKLLWKILIPIITLITILMAVSGYLSYRESAASLEKAVIDNMRGEAEALKRMTNTVLGDCLNSVIRFSTESNLQEFYKGDIHDKEKGLALANWLAGLIKTYPFIDRVNVFDPEGAIISSSNPAVIGQNFKTREYFTTAFRGSDFVSNPFMSNITKQGVLIVSTPVRMDNKVVGVVNATISLPQYFETVISHVRVGDSGYAYAIDGDGKLVVHRKAEWLFRDDLQASGAYKKMAASPDGSVEFVNNEGTESFAYYVKEPFSHMTLVVQADKSDVFEDLGRLAQNSLIVVLAGIVLGVVVLLFLVRPIVQALNRGVVYATEIAKGNLDGKLDIHRKDEIGVLADALRAIPESLESIIAEYQRLESEIVKGNLTVQGEAAKFSGDFAQLVQGTNAMLGRYQLILNALTTPVVVLDKTLHIVYMNGSAQALAGNDYMGKTCGQIMAREDFGTPACAMRRAVDTLRPATAETVAHPLGKNLDISYTAIPFVDKEGKLATVLQIITDLTAIKSTQRTIVDVANQAQDISNRVATASEQLSAQVEQVRKGADVQRGRAESTATAMEEMNSTVLEVARNAGEASQQAKDTRSKAKEGAELVSQVIDAIGKVQEVALGLEKNMQQLGTQAEAIGSVMNVISDIADQTNLLALNAAIEAARAGEAGRGFAVVADEVRKLAEKTMGATTEVGSSIRGIQESTAENIRRVATAGQGVGKATELATVSGQALDEIQTLVDANAALITSIATAAEQQSATSEEINQAVDDINRIAGETAGGMEQSSSAVHDLSKMAQELKSLLQRLQQ